MRSVLASITAVAFLANASLANAADGPTTPVAGYCVWSPDPVLTELSVLLDDADCASRNAIAIDPRIETTVRKSPVHEGPRAFGEPSAVRVEIEVAVVVDPLSSERPSRLTFFWEQYDSFKGAVHSYNEAVDRIAEPIGEAHATYMDVVVFHGAPKWVKNLDAALARTTVNVAGGMLALGPNLVLLPEAVMRAPEGILSGGSKIRRGVSAGQYDYAAKGVAEVCGGVGVLASLAVPVAGRIGGRAPLSIRPRPAVAGAPTEAIAPVSSLPTATQALQRGGSGPVPGVIEVSNRYPSTKALQNYDPAFNPKYGERTIEFIYDPSSKSFAVGQPRVKTGSGHESLAHVLGADDSRVVGGHFSRGKDGAIVTNENSGHYWKNWTPEVRTEFVDFLESRTGQTVQHSTQ